MSRVFGLQSEDVTTSIHTEEMSTFPEQQDEGDDKGHLVSLHASDENHYSAEEEELRMPESDQGTTTDEEYAHAADVDLDDETGFKNGHDNGTYNRNGSILKVGQLSSDEEYRDAIDSENDEDDQEEDPEYVIEEDRPLFARNSSDANIKKETETVGSTLPKSMLFQRILQHNNQKQKKKQLFTSSKDEHLNSRVGNEEIKNDRGYERDLEAGLGTGEGRRKTFMNDDRPRGNRAFTSNFPLKRPNLFKNISVLNKTPANKVNTLSPRERALWKWANVDNLDLFLQDVYRYYLGNGYFCIILEKILNLATLIFVIFTSTYGGYCIDYSKISTSNRLSDVTIDKCYSSSITGFTKLLLWIFYVFVVLKIAQLYFDVQNLKDIHNFYSYLLNVSDKELQTIPWQTIIQQIMYLKDQNALTANVLEVKAKNRIDAHDVANRIMRKENYLIAMYNNEVLDLSLPFPLYRTSTLTKTLEWNINLCILGYAFNESGLIKQSFLKPSQHEYIKEELKKRFLLAGFLNIVLSPFLVTYFLLLYFLRYFNEYKTSPGTLGARQYTLMAEWKFREYNELFHLFQKRMGLSTELANRYINQFPKEETNLMFKFVAFISGSFVAILAILTVFDPENFLNFEITNDRTALFYITVMGAIWTVCRNSVSDEYNVFDPEETLQELATYTHYMPHEWEGRYHTEEVKNEFCKLYNLRIIVLVRELASLVITPFILWYSLPKSADRIVEFFRDNTIHVDGLGYVCKYAMFDINETLEHKNGKSKLKAPLQSKDTQDGRKVNLREIISEDLSDTNDSDSEENDAAVNKMMQSYMYFIDDYENSSKVVGKHQLPTKRYGDETKLSPMLNNSYSWKKQFRPGQKPELFRIGKHSLETRQPVATNKSSTTSKKKRSVNRRLSENDNINLGNSFIGSIPAPSYELQNNIKSGNSRNESGAGGIFNLVKEFYNQSELGR